MIITRFSLRNVSASLSIAAPTFMRGPIAISVTSLGLCRICSSRKVTASGWDGLA